MSNNYIGSGSNQKLITLVNEFRDGILVLRPSFQRKLVWNNSHKEKFIETILLELPFPEVYLCDGEVDVESQKSTRWVVDGQQRLSTIHQYIEGEIKFKKISAFKDLPIDKQRSFFNYKIVVRDLGELSDQNIREIFKRINSIQYALNATEIRNALYEGEYISLAKTISEDRILEKLKVFSENQISRMKNLEFITLVMSTIEINGYFTRDSEVGDLVASLDDRYPGKLTMKKDILDVIKLIIKLDLPADSIWFRLSNFFTLTVELIKYKRKNKKLPRTVLLKRRISRLEKFIETNKNKDSEKNEYAKYYYYVYQATASKAARIYRGKIIKKHLS